MRRRLPLESWFAAAIRDALPPDDYRAAIELSRAEGLDDKAIERAFHDAVAEVLGSPALAMHLTAAFAAECIAGVVAERYGACHAARPGPCTDPGARARHCGAR